MNDSKYEHKPHQYQEMSMLVKRFSFHNSNLRVPFDGDEDGIQPKKNAISLYIA